MSIVLDSMEHPHGFGVWDNSNNRSVIRVDEDGSIHTPSIVLQDSEWTTMTVGSQELQVKNLGLFLFVKGTLDTSTLANETYFNLPSGFPHIKGNQAIYPISCGGNTIGKFIVKNNGSLAFTKGNVTGTATFNTLIPLI